MSATLALRGASGDPRITASYWCNPITPDGHVVTGGRWRRRLSQARGDRVGYLGGVGGRWPAVAADQRVF